MLPPPTGGALALADNPKCPRSETNSFCPCAHAEATGLCSTGPESPQTPWGEHSQMGTPSIPEVLPEGASSEPTSLPHCLRGWMGIILKERWTKDSVEQEKGIGREPCAPVGLPPERAV